MSENGKGEAEVVRGSDLAPYLQEWCVKWLADRPDRMPTPRFPHSRHSTTVDVSGSYVKFIGPIQWLEFESAARGRPINRRRISGIANGEFEFVPLSQADTLLGAIDKEYLLSNRTIEILPNRNWSLEKWVKYMEERGCV